MFLTIKKIPKVSWSSKKPLNLKPKVSTFLFLCFGLSLFGIGEGLLLVSYTGASPWSVLAQGISLNIDQSNPLIGVPRVIAFKVVGIFSVGSEVDQNYALISQDSFLKLIKPTHLRNI